MKFSLFRRRLGQPLEDVFEFFNPEPAVQTHFERGETVPPLLQRLSFRDVSPAEARHWSSLAIVGMYAESEDLAGLESALMKLFKS